MKITDASKTPPPASAARAKSAAAPAAGTSGAPALIVDEISFAGIPSSEITPRVRDALVQLVSEVQALRAELAATKARMNELEQLADSDPLLGVLNRRAFVRELNRTLAMVERYNAPAALVFADINELKKINDTMGHGAGDAALRRVGRVIAANIRQTDAIGRIGGDEFGIILVQTDLPAARQKAEVLAALVDAEPVGVTEGWDGEPFLAKVSLGVVEIAAGSTIEEALALADSAMYEAKKAR